MNKCINCDRFLSCDHAQENTEECCEYVRNNHITFYE